MLCYAMLSHFSHVRLCATPETAAPQAPPSLGFSRQEQWSGLPFPSPMHEREKRKWSRSVVSDSEWPHGLQPTRRLHPWDFPGKSTGVGRNCDNEGEVEVEWFYEDLQDLLEYTQKRCLFLYVASFTQCNYSEIHRVHTVVCINSTAFLIVE